MSIYVDTSAWAKLVKQERESGAFADYVDDCLDRGDQFVSSALLVTELGRLAAMAGIDRADVSDTLDRVNIFLPQMSVYRAAGRLPGTNLRSLGALHVVHCQEIGADVLASYDTRQLAAARAAGIRIISPGASTAE